MIPSEPGIAGPNPLIQHLTTLHEQFKAFDTAKEKVHGSPWFGGGPDNRVSKDDLKAVAEDGAQSGRFTRSQVEAAQFFLSHPEALARLDTAAVSDNAPGTHEAADGFIGELDAKAALRDARDFDGAATFKSQQPAVPADDANQAQQDAAMVLRYQDLPLPAGSTTSPEQVFTQVLHRHKDDAAYLNDFFGALGSNAAGRALFNALNGGGHGREHAREAIATLQGLGLLNEKDLSAGSFKTTARSSDSFSLETLIAADRIQRQAEVRRDKMEGASDAEDSTVYNAYQALLTVESPEHRQLIKETAEKYGIEPALLAGSVAAEMDFDHSAVNKALDGLWRLGIPALRLGTGPGIASVHYDSLTWALGYLQGRQSPVAHAAAEFIRSDPEQGKAADFGNSIESAAIVLAALQDAHKRLGAGDSAQDMAVVWGAYRGGVIGLNPQGEAYSQQGFGANQVDEPDARKLVETTGDPDAAMGGNAYQSEAYFEHLIKSYG